MTKLDRLLEVYILWTCVAMSRGFELMSFDDYIEYRQDFEL